MLDIGEPIAINITITMLIYRHCSHITPSDTFRKQVWDSTPEHGGNKCNQFQPTALHSNEMSVVHLWEIYVEDFLIIYLYM